MLAGDLGDHIGMESCVDLGIDTESALSSGGGAPVNRKLWGMSNRRSAMSGRNGKELPPPLPIQTSMVMKRYYTDDGRLIITEEKIESPKYHFTAHRSHGRLTLQLVPSDSICDVETKRRPCENGGEKDVSMEDECSSKVAMDSKVAIVSGGGDVDGGSRGGGGGVGVDRVGKCFTYNTAVRVAATGPCLFVNQNQLHAIRPVQI